VLRNADAIVYCHEASAPLRGLEVVRAEVVAAGIDKPAVLAATKLDDAGEQALERLAAAVPDLPVLGVSVLDDDSLDMLREEIWTLTGLIRVWLHHGGETDPAPIALHAGATIAEVAHQVHHQLAASFAGARVWGPSARFDGQRVGRGHVVADGDTVEILR
jgi:hypothetical protein